MFGHTLGQIGLLQSGASEAMLSVFEAMNKHWAPGMNPKTRKMIEIA